MSLAGQHHILITPAAKKELVDDALATDPGSPSYREALASALRFQYHMERNSIGVIDLDYKKYGKFVDEARRRLARLEGTREDRTPKADAEMAAAIAQLRASRRTFRVLCDDLTLVEQVLRPMFPGVGFVGYADLIG